MIISTDLHYTLASLRFLPPALFRQILTSRSCRSLQEKVEAFRNRQKEKAAELAAAASTQELQHNDEAISSDEESQEDTYYVDWRAKHL